MACNSRLPLVTRRGHDPGSWTVAALILISTAVTNRPGSRDTAALPLEPLMVSTSFCANAVIVPAALRNTFPAAPAASVTSPAEAVVPCDCGVCRPVLAGARGPLETTVKLWPLTDVDFKPLPVPP